MLFVLEKGLLPRNPLVADSGDGCGDVITWFLDVSTRLVFSCACFPHRMNTRLFFDESSIFMRVSVNCPHPFFECELGWCALTVRTQLSINTP